WLLIGVPVLLVLALLLSEDVRYVARAGLEEARILFRRRPIAPLVADARTPPELRRRLALVLAARAYAADALRLSVGDTYTTYVDTGRDTLLLVLSASRRDERTLDVLWSELARRLDSAYAGAPSGPALERARATLFGWARGQLTGPVGQGLETYDWRWFAGAPLNNAVVIAQRLYRMNLNLFDAVYLQNNADIAETIRAIQVRVFTQPDRDPYKA